MYVYTHRHLLRIAGMMHMKKIITIFLRHNGLERVRISLLYISLYIYIYEIHCISEKW